MPVLICLVVLLFAATIVYVGFLRKPTDTKATAARSIARTSVWVFFVWIALFVVIGMLGSLVGP
jgi:hypothetical protein